jgi:steroid 5-alpha reductase family enzyme
MGNDVLAAFVYMIVVFFLAWIREDNSIVDIAWGGGFIIVSFFSLLQGGHIAPRSLLVTALVSIWGLRLAWHIYRRNRGRGEDFRYRAWRESWGKWFRWRSFFQIFMLQGLILVVVALPVIWVNRNTAPGLAWTDGFALAVWLFGFGFEAVGDRQLTQFRKNPENHGKIMASGLWRYSRHPNYFGEATLWWGMSLFALAVPLGWIGLAGPLVITLMLRFVSGVPLLEKKYAGNSDFRDYRNRTPVFVPWIPRRKTGS